MNGESRTKPILWALALSLLVASAGAAQAALMVEATVTPIVGGFHYDVSITNPDLDDVVIVSLTDAPPADPLIGASLTGPVGFLTSYDAGLGFVDFLGDTDLFAAGTTKEFFRFDSASPPGPGVFSTFEALTVAGGFLSGDIEIRVKDVPVIPEPATLGLFAVGLAGLSAVARRKRSR